MIKENNNYTKIGFGAVFAVASVLFSSHAGGGFASGNQATQYFVGNGVWGVISAIVAMALLALTIKECIVMKNSRNLKNYKELFETLYHPFDKLEWLFEIYFNIMVICAVGAVIAGASSLISANGIMGYKMAVMGVGIILLIMTIFGSSLVSKVSTVMSICILISTFIIFFMGIKAKAPEISIIFSQPGRDRRSLSPRLSVPGMGHPCARPSHGRHLSSVTTSDCSTVRPLPHQC